MGVPAVSTAELRAAAGQAADRAAMACGLAGQSARKLYQRTPTPVATMAGGLLLGLVLGLGMQGPVQPCPPGSLQAGGAVVSRVGGEQPRRLLPRAAGIDHEPDRDSESVDDLRAWNFILESKLELLGAQLRELQRPADEGVEEEMDSVADHPAGAGGDCAALGDEARQLRKELQVCDLVKQQARDGLQLAVKDAMSLEAILKQQGITVGARDARLHAQKALAEVSANGAAGEGSSSPSSGQAGSAQPPGFLGRWAEVEQADWMAMLRRRGCRDAGFRDKIQCCEPELFPNFTTPVKRLLLQTPVPFKASRLQRILQGGGITFVGDSITSQIYNALVFRAVREKFVMLPTNISEQPLLSTASATFLHPHTGNIAFHAALYRLDKAKDVATMVRHAVPLLGTQARYGDRKARQVVVANIGLHYSEHDTNQTDAFRRDLAIVVERLVSFNRYSGNLGLLRDISPQHFKPRDAASATDALGSYAKRDLGATACQAWSGSGASAEPEAPSAGGQLSQHRNNYHNTLMLQAAIDAGLAVQRTAPLLSTRYDAHLETRDAGKSHILDCTHWCAAVFDVFEDTLLWVLATQLNIDFDPEEWR